MVSTLVIYYVETNLICILLIGFLRFSYVRESRGSTEAGWFLAALRTVQIYCVADMLAALFKNQVFAGARAVLWAANTVYITIPLVLIYFWYHYLKEHMRDHYHPGKIFRTLDRVFPIVSLVVCAISLSTPLTHSTFYLDELNGYHRTVGAYAVPMFTYLFMLYETLKLRIISRETGSLQVRHDALILSAFALPCICFSLIQVCLYGTTVSQVGFTMGLMIVYMGRQRIKISRDELTGLNNRREYKYAIDRIAKGSGTALIAMIDVNDFKKINDTYGHLEGDQALRAVAMILRNVCANRKQMGSVGLYRYGGDEFTMISTDPNVRDMKEVLLETIAEETEKWNAKAQKAYRISLSVGVAVGEYNGGEIYRLIEVADQEMYADKAKKKVGR